MEKELTKVKESDVFGSQSYKKVLGDLFPSRIRKKHCPCR
jgi:hypothetical protein